MQFFRAEQSFFVKKRYFRLAMTEQEAYNNCIEQIEFYRNKREQIIQENDLLQKQILALLANDAKADVSALQAKIAHNEQLDEEYGAKMHELTIQRNLLEP